MRLALQRKNTALIPAFLRSLCVLVLALACLGAELCDASPILLPQAQPDVVADRDESGAILREHSAQTVAARSARPTPEKDARPVAGLASGDPDFGRFFRAVYAAATPGDSARGVSFSHRSRAPPATA